MASLIFYGLVLRKQQNSVCLSFHVVHEQQGSWKLIIQTARCGQLLEVFFPDDYLD
jgi:hypothetical protein